MFSYVSGLIISIENYFSKAVVVEKIVRKITYMYITKLMSGLKMNYMMSHVLSFTCTWHSSNQPPTIESGHRISYKIACVPAKTQISLLIRIFAGHFVGS